MNKVNILLAAALFLLPAAGCTAVDTPGDGTTGDTTPLVVEGDPSNANFLLLLSDAPNDIGDFTELWVTVSRVGFVKEDGEGIDEVEFELDDRPSVNLVDLTDDNAVALWGGEVPDGTYTKVFVYVEHVDGVLAESGETIEVKLPSGKLHVDAPVTIGDKEDGEVTEYVFDVTIHRAGNSGQYILQPQLSESGAGQQYRLLEHTEERVRLGRPDWAGKPEGAGNPDQASGPPDADDGASAGKPDGIGQAHQAGKPEGAGELGDPRPDDDDSAPSPPDTDEEV